MMEIRRWKVLVGHLATTGCRALRRGWVLTTLIVLAIGLGIGATMTMVTVLHVMSDDPIPGKSAHLYYPHLQPAPPGYLAMDPGSRFTWRDATQLLSENRAQRQAVMAPGRVAVTPPGHRAFYEAGHYVSAQFFSMFDTPFAAGTGWKAGDDETEQRVTVLNGGMARRLFGTEAAAVGKMVALQGREFQVIGVLADWHPAPLFYGGAAGDWAFRSEDEFFLPLSTAMRLELPIAGGETCWGAGDRKSDACAWLQFWVELDSPAQVADYRQFLVNYWHTQVQAGRPVLDIKPELLTFRQRLDTLHLVPANVRLQFWLAAGFFGVCLFNTVSLMLAKFLRRSGEIGVRRALGASRMDIFLQFGMEAGALGMVGGCLGIAFTHMGLWLIHQRPDAYARLAHVDTSIVMATVITSLVASLVAGLLPAWRASHVVPTLQA